MTDTAKAVESLARVPIFAGLGTDDLQTLAEHCVERSFEAGEALAERGVPNDGLFVLVEGAADVTRGGRLFTTLGPGDAIGDMSLIDGEPHSVNAVATDPGYGLFLAGYQYQVVVKNRPEVALAFIRTLVARLRETMGWLEEAEQSVSSEDT